LTVSCVPDLEYKTKGRIDKVFPVPPILDQLLAIAASERIGGPLLPSRAHFEGRKAVSPLLATKQQMIDEYQRRIDGDRSARQRLKTLDSLFREAGAVTYDQLSREFQKMVCRANLTAHLTLKSLRHNFAAALEKANISYFTRKYFMGHRVRRDPLAIYTTTNLEGIRMEFSRLLKGPMAPILIVAAQRIKRLGKSHRI
jgi:integrase